MNEISLPEDYKLRFTNHEISKVITKVSTDISLYLKSMEYDYPPIFVNILKGGTLFFAQLVQQISFPLELGNIGASSYYSNASSGYVSINYIDFDAKGRVIFLIDDIFDSGATLSSVKTKLLNDGAKEVFTVSLIYRPNSSKITTIILPDFYGIKFNAEDWVVGFGIDDSGLYRNLPNIYTIRKKDD